MYSKTNKMETQIVITGGICSIHTLRGAVNDYNAEERRGMFYSVILTFKTKKEAVEALSEGRKYLKNEGKEIRGYSRGNSLSYDAGVAKIMNL